MHNKNSRTMSLSVPSVVINPNSHEHYTNEFSLFIQRLLYLEGISLKKCATPINTFEPSLNPQDIVGGL